MRMFPSAFVLFLACSATTALAQEASRLTTASNVRLRATPDDIAAVVASVPLGTELLQLDTGGPAAAWLRVRTNGGPDGWLPAKLTRRFTPETRIDAVEAIVKDRLSRQGDSFGARVELLDLVERTLPRLTAPEPGGRFALLWLSALDNVAARIPRTQGRNEPYAGWLKAHERVVFFHEMAGRWQVRQQAVLDLHARHRDTSSADDIAWFAATAGLPGECEAWVPCHVRRINELDGTYLQAALGRYARRRHRRAHCGRGDGHDAEPVLFRSGQGLRRARRRGCAARGRRRRDARGRATARPGQPRPAQSAL